MAKSSKFRVYLGKTEKEEPIILKVATTFENGDVLAKEASKFNLMRASEADIRKFESAKKRDSHYDWLFAKLINSFMEPSQGDRRINVFAMPDADLAELTPLAKLSNTVEIDVRTSIWIFGRLLKFYGFFELIAENGDIPFAQYPVFSPDDYFIGPQNHRLIYYNFIDDVNDAVAFDFVKTIANFIDNWVVIDENDENEKEYKRLLKDYVKRGRQTFELAHGELYRLVERLFGRKYHPFTYRDKGTITWKVMENIKEG